MRHFTLKIVLAFVRSLEHNTFMDSRLARIELKEQIMITIEIDRIPADMNKFVAQQIKQRGLSVVEADVQVLVKSEPRRTWVKRPGQTSVTAYG